MTDPTRRVDHETPGAYVGTATALDRIAALVERFTDASDLMVSKADLRELLALVGAVPGTPAATTTDLASERRTATEGAAPWLT